MDLRANDLSGTLPESFYKLSNLVYAVTLACCVCVHCLQCAIVCLFSVQRCGAGLQSYERDPGQRHWQPCEPEVSVGVSGVRV